MVRSQFPVLPGVIAGSSACVAIDSGAQSVTPRLDFNAVIASLCLPITARVAKR